MSPPPVSSSDDAKSPGDPHRRLPTLSRSRRRHEGPRPSVHESVVRPAVRTFPAKDIRVRVGLGDPTNRDRILKALARDALRVEVVDEAGTTHRTAQPDVDAAIDIAKSSGRGVEAPVEIRPTPGEVREIQRRSRLDSGGVVTISSELAGAVARGDLTLEEAITRAKRKERQSQG